MQNNPLLSQQRVNDSNSAQPEDLVRINDGEPRQTPIVCHCRSCKCEPSRRSTEDDSASPMRTFSEGSCDSLDEDSYLSDSFTSQEGVEDHQEDFPSTHYNHVSMEHWGYPRGDSVTTAIFTPRASLPSCPFSPPCVCSRVENSLSMLTEPTDSGSMTHSTMSLPPRRTSDGSDVLRGCGSMFDGHASCCVDQGGEESRAFSLERHCDHLSLESSDSEG